MVGVSSDSVEGHRRFREANSLPFILVSDSGKEIMRRYDVLRRFGLGASRITYLIDKDGVIRDVFHHEIRIGRHIGDVLKGLRALGTGTPG